MLKHKKTSQHKHYSVKDGKLERSRRLCPRCGDSFLAQHKNRVVCGKCLYSEFKA
ncbi:MAG: 30S ribosomal protein S27ae [Candidatus Aenigmarchaeota archaeon]|nr:30S ribosomal protein S27ae [Candidatus Aenigmarchaeota archaeon]